jgi:hypothetical protein
MSKITEYAKWRRQMGWTHEKAAKELDITSSHSKNYEKGINRSRGNAIVPPLSIRIHMRILAEDMKIQPWPE